MEQITSERYASFDAARKTADLEASEREYEDELREIEKAASTGAAAKRIG
jgi:hypothetical protein